MKRMSEADCWRAIPVRLGTFGVMPDPLGVLLPAGAFPASVECLQPPERRFDGEIPRPFG